MSRVRISSFLRPIPAAHFRLRSITPFTSVQQIRHASQDYGSGQGDPKGSNPQDQGSNPSAELEHPGPPPPSVGQGTGGGPTKAREDGHNTQQNSSSGGGSGQGASETSGAQPKIHDAKIPPEESEEVRQHNEDMGKRHDRSHNQIGDDGKVDKGFWSGELKLVNLWVVETDRSIRSRWCRSTAMIRRSCGR